MTTEALPVSADRPEPETIGRAAAVLRAGGLVAFPTETVYGLGANALDADAVGRIFAAKGRPSNNPLIVHVADVEQAKWLTTSWPPLAAELAARFWPGPLTLVLPRRPEVPAIVTAGGPTVAIRMPAHPVARALIRAAGVPVAAPSANRSGQLSPTRAEHVLEGLSGRIDLVLDAGPVERGIESTVLDLTTSPPRLLRPGPLAPQEIEDVVGAVVRPVADARASPGPLPSPGLLSRHYAPRTPLELAGPEAARRVEELAAAGVRVGWVTFEGEAPSARPEVRTVLMPRAPAAYAAQLYAVLHALDQENCDRLVVTLPEESDAWLAVRDRLRRAAASG